MQFCAIILIISSLQTPTSSTQKTSIGLTGGVLLQLSDDESEAWPTFGSVMEFSMPGLNSFAVCGNTRISWYNDKLYGLCLRNITMVLGSKYTKRLPELSMGFYIGGGPGVHLYNWEKKESNKGDNWVGFHLFTGIERYFLNSKICCFSEIDYGKEIGKKEKFPGFGDLSQFVFSVGIRF